MAKVVTTIDCQASEGINHINFVAGQPLEVPEKLLPMCRAAGAAVVGETDPPTDVTADSEGVRMMALVDAMLTIMASADKALFTRDGEPREQAIRDIVGFKFTRAEREQAMAQCAVDYGDGK